MLVYPKIVLSFFQGAIPVGANEQSKLREQLTQARKGMGLSPVELADRPGRPQFFVSKYERDERRPDLG